MTTKESLPSGEREFPVGRYLDPPGVATHKYLVQMQERFLGDDPTAVATLARLRGGVRHRVYENLELGKESALEQLFQDLGSHDWDDELPEVFPWGRLDHAEEAVHMAVTLWATHQQSSTDRGMFQPRRPLGEAVRDLMGDGFDQALHKRFVRTGGATSLESLRVRLRDLVQLLRRGREPVDYALLADQLCRWQNESQRLSVRREWGREFQRAEWRISRQKNARRGDRDTSRTPDEVDDPDYLDMGD